jgi:succinyl-CoA synthetase beta subunit
VQRRNLSIHEYQSMGLLSQYGVVIPKGIVASSPEEALRATKEIGGIILM